MLMQSYFEIEPDASTHNAVSPNEARAMVKNRIEDKKLITRFRMMNQEAKLNFIDFMSCQNEAAKSAKHIRASTGYAECTRELRIIENRGKFSLIRLRLKV